MALNNHALFQVTLKAVVKKQEEILLLITQDGYFDFPGGRIDESEVDIPFTSNLEREIAEECGNNFTLKILGPAFIAKRQYTKNGQTHKIIAIYYEALYVGGDITLSDEHSNYEWVKPAELIKYPDKFVSKDEFEQFDNYLARGAKKMS